MNKNLKIINIVEDLFHYNRSLSSDDNIKTLEYLQNINTDLKIKYFKQGQNVYDWTIPKRWNVKNAYIKDKNGNILIDFNENNLHLVGYSIPFKGKISFEELKNHLYFDINIPLAIPYITSYYEKRWGFCLTKQQYDQFKDGEMYEVVVDTVFSDDDMPYGEIIIPGKSEKEILFSTYICHPSMANNELSGVAVTTFLSNYVKTIDNYYTYRFIFVPETIGSIAYIHKNIANLQQNVVGGYVVTCVGDDNNYSLVKSRYGDNISDKIAEQVLKDNNIDYKEYSYLMRGSDERQFCSPLVNLPISSICRTKYGEFREYHTSLDNLNYISEEGLQGAYLIYKDCINLFENNFTYVSNVFCEPNLGKRGLYSTLSFKSNKIKTKIVPRDYLNFISYADGQNDFISILNYININHKLGIEIKNILIKNQLIKLIDT